MDRVNTTPSFLKNSNFFRKQDPVFNYIDRALSQMALQLEHQVASLDDRLIEKFLRKNSEHVNYARPAHAIVHIVPTDSKVVVQDGQEFCLALEEEEYRFTSVGTHRILRAEVKELVRPKFFAPGAVAHPDFEEFWIGMDIDESITTLNGLSLFFGKEAVADHAGWERDLVHLNWFYQGEKLPTKIGIPCLGKAKATKINQLYGPEFQVKKQMGHCYRQRFVTFGSNASLVREPCPARFKDFCSPEQLQKYTQPVVWLRVKCPALISDRLLRSLWCITNCIPIWNKVDVVETFETFHSTMNTFGLPLQVSKSTDDRSDTLKYSLFAVQQVYNEDREIYHRAGLLPNEPATAGVWEVQSRGVVKEGHQAHSSFSQVIEQLYEHFHLLSEEDRSRVREIIVDLKSMADCFTEQQTGQYLTVKNSHPTRSLHVRYSLTNGAGVGSALVGHYLAATDDSAVHSAFLVTPIFPGQNRPEGEHLRRAFTRDVLSGGTVTRASIRSWILGFLGHQVSDVEVEVVYNYRPFAEDRHILVKIAPSNPAMWPAPTWASACRILQADLQEQSAMLYPFKVELVLRDNLLNPNDNHQNGR